MIQSSLDHRISNTIIESIALKQMLLDNEDFKRIIQDIADQWVHTFEQGGKILFCGNGGSAADAQHLAAELSGRYFFDREPLPAEALHVNSSYLTAVANDYSYDEVYARMIRAIGKAGDILIALSTSGNSPNIIRAIEDAKSRNMQVIGFTGADGGKMNTLCDYIVKIPSKSTPRIQECHIMVGHILCEITESRLFEKKL
jgi:D-sedoheptulose 7-phosphate isomerase